MSSGVLLHHSRLQLLDLLLHSSKIGIQILRSDFFSHDDDDQKDVQMDDRGSEECQNGVRKVLKDDRRMSG